MENHINKSLKSSVLEGTFERHTKIFQPVNLTLKVLQHLAQTSLVKPIISLKF
jgi:hypothetical protein